MQQLIVHRWTCSQSERTSSRRFNVPTLAGNVLVDFFFFFWKDIKLMRYWFSVEEPLYVCAFRAHQSCFNTRSQTLNKEIRQHDQIQPNYSKRFLLLCLPGSPLASVSSDAPQWMFPHKTLLIEMSLIWMYLLYFNRGVLNEMMILEDIADRSIKDFRGNAYDQVLLYSRFTHVAGPFLKHRRDEKKSHHLISSQGTMLSFHMLGFDETGRHWGLMQEHFYILLLNFNSLFL